MKAILMTQLLPHLFDYLSVAILGGLFYLLKRFTGIEIDAKHRAALQSALANGSKLLLQPGGTIDDAIDYVLTSVPDALKRFGIHGNHDRIAELLEPHVLALPALPRRVDVTVDGAAASAGLSAAASVLR